MVLWLSCLKRLPQETRDMRVVPALAAKADVSFALHNNGFRHEAAESKYQIDEQIGPERLCYSRRSGKGCESGEALLFLSGNFLGET